MQFLPQRRLRFTGDRLRGRHPGAILRDELADSHVAWVQDMGTRNPTKLENIIAGTDDPRRAAIFRRPGLLTPTEQADCLIQQATDPNVLGRTWLGWCPEI